MTPIETQLIVELSEGNPGAAVALAELCRIHDAVDPYAEGGAFINLLQLQDLGLAGPSIHILFKDVCRCEAARLVMLIRAWQLGILPASQLQLAAVRGSDVVLDTDSLWDRVNEELPRFQKRT